MWVAEAVPAVLMALSPSAPAGIPAISMMSAWLWDLPICVLEAGLKMQEPRENFCHAWEMWAASWWWLADKHICPIFGWLNCCPGMTLFTKMCLYVREIQSISFILFIFFSLLIHDLQNTCISGMFAACPTAGIGVVDWVLQLLGGHSGNLSVWIARVFERNSLGGEGYYKQINSLANAEECHEKPATSVSSTVKMTSRWQKHRMKIWFQANCILECFLCTICRL